MVFAKNSAQTIEFGTSYSSGNVPFYKNVPSVFLGFNYNFKHQTIFLNLSTSFKNYTYSLNYRDSYYNDIIIINGKMYVNSLRLGLSQILLNTENSRISIGGYGSVTYFKYNDNWTHFFVSDSINSHWSGTRNHSYNNRIGFGGFIDFEIKHVFFDNVSLFTRIAGEDIVHYQEEVYGGDPFNYSNIQFLSCFVGVRINLKKENS